MISTPHDVEVLPFRPRVVPHAASTAKTRRHDARRVEECQCSRLELQGSSSLRDGPLSIWRLDMHQALVLCFVWLCLERKASWLHNVCGLKKSHERGAKTNSTSPFCLRRRLYSHERWHEVETKKSFTKEAHSHLIRSPPSLSPHHTPFTHVSPSTVREDLSHTVTSGLFRQRLKLTRPNCPKCPNCPCALGHLELCIEAFGVVDGVCHGRGGCNCGSPFRHAWQQSVVLTLSPQSCCCEGALSAVVPDCGTSPPV